MTTPTTPKAGDITEEITQALARGYCDRENQNKVLDPELIMSMTKEVDKVFSLALAKQKESIKEQLRMNKVPVELEIPRLFQPVSTRNQMGGYSSVPFYCSLCGMSECEIQDNKLNGAYNCDCSVWTSPCDGEWVQWHNKEKAQKFSENMPSEDTVWNKAVDKFNEKLDNL